VPRARGIKPNFKIKNPNHSNLWVFFKPSIGTIKTIVASYRVLHPIEAIKKLPNQENSLIFWAPKNNVFRGFAISVLRNRIFENLPELSKNAIAHQEHGVLNPILK